MNLIINLINEFNIHNMNIKRGNDKTIQIIYKKIVDHFAIIYTIFNIYFTFIVHIQLKYLKRSVT